LAASQIGRSSAERRKSSITYSAAYPLPLRIPCPATLATAEERYRDDLSVERVAAELGLRRRRCFVPWSIVV